MKILKLALALMLSLLPMLAWASTQDTSPVPLKLQHQASATQNGESLDVFGYPTVSVSVSGTFVGTISFESEYGDGAGFVTQPCTEQTTSPTAATTATAVSQWRCDVTGAKNFRARVSAFTSGTINVFAVAMVAGGGAGSTGGGGGSGVTDIDDSSFAVGSDDLAPTGYLADETTPDSVDEGDVGVPRMSLNRIAYNILRDAAGNERGANINSSNQLEVNLNSVLAASPANATGPGFAPFGIRDDTLSALTVIEGDFDYLRLDSQGALHVTGAGGGVQYNENDLDTTGTFTLIGFESNTGTSEMDLVSATTPLPVDVVQGAALGGTAIDHQAGSPTVDDGTPAMFFVDDTATSILDEGDLGWPRMSPDRIPYFQGGVAHDAVDSDFPIKVGLKALAHSSNPTAVAAGDVTDWYANRHGMPFVSCGHPNTVTRVYRATGAQTDDDMLGAIGTGTKIVLTRVQTRLDEATTVGVGFRIGFAATTLPTEPADGAGADDIVEAHPGLVPGGGTNNGNGCGIVAVGGDGEELRITNGAPTSGGLKVLVSYYTIES
ncbi:MAG: hypothetical protein ACR2NF_08955 [Pirellulales bacterium]